MESRIAEFGILHAVELLGAVPHTEMASVYASMDVLALPSHREGLPMCILEGAAAGWVVVASRVGAIPTVIEHRTNGVLVQPRDAGALAKGTSNGRGRAAVGPRLRSLISLHAADAR